MVKKRIGILGFDGVSALDLTGPLEAFWNARTHNGQQAYEVLVMGLSAKRFTAHSGLVFNAVCTLDVVSDLDTIIIPGGIELENGALGKNVSAWLAAQSDRPKRFVSISSGIYALASAGLLEGRRVATHWRMVREVARRFPRLRASATASFIKDGPYYTCSDGKAGIEMAIYLIQEDYGTQAALAVARELVMDLRPPGDDEPPIQLLSYTAGSADRVAALPGWVANHLTHDLSVEVLAERSALCRRHFSRLFHRVFNASPADFVEQIRLSEARRRLLMPHHSVESVALSTGYKSADAFRRAFERRFGVSPNRFRRRFSPRVNNVADVRRAASAHLVLQRKVHA